MASSVIRYKIEHERFKDWVVMIYQIDHRGRITFPNGPMVVSSGSGSESLLTAGYLRDLNFCFPLKDGDTFRVGILIYDPSRIRNGDLFAHIKRARESGSDPAPMDGLYFLGYYTHLFDLSREREGERANHLIVTKERDSGGNPVKFDLYYHIISRERHRHYYTQYYGVGWERRENIDDIKELYIVSNPFIEFDLAEI